MKTQKTRTETDKPTYTVVTRDYNGSQVGTVTWDCGHKHHSAMAAYQCWLSMGSAGCAYHATVEASEGDHPRMDDLAAEHYQTEAAKHIF